MQYITGKIIFISEPFTINGSDGKDFQGLYLVISKRMNKKPRKICFEVFGRLAREVRAFRIGDKVEIDYFIHSNESKNKNWLTTLVAKDVAKYVKRNDSDFNQEKIEYQDDYKH